MRHHAYCGFLPMYMWIALGVSVPSVIRILSASMPSDFNVCQMTLTAAPHSGVLASSIWIIRPVNTIIPACGIPGCVNTGIPGVLPRHCSQFIPAALSVDPICPINGMHSGSCCIEKSNGIPVRSYGVPAKSFSFAVMRSCCSVLSERGVLNFSNANCASEARASASNAFWFASAACRINSAIFSSESLVTSTSPTGSRRRSSISQIGSATPSMSSIRSWGKLFWNDLLVLDAF